MRYRQRKTDYVKSLETDVVDLQQSVTAVGFEKNSLALENAEMMKLLRLKLSDDGTLRMFERSFPSGESSSTTSHHEHAIVSLKHTSETGERHVAVTPARHYHTTYDQEPPDLIVAGPTDPPSRDITDTWEAIDFILMLETPCRDHVHLPTHLPDRRGHASVDSDGPSNHAMTMTSAVYARTTRFPDGWTYHHPPGVDVTDGNVATYGFVPHFELERCSYPTRKVNPNVRLIFVDRLLEFSKALQSDELYMTPIQVYASLKGTSQLRAAVEGHAEASPRSDGAFCRMLWFWGRDVD